MRLAPSRPTPADDVRRLRDELASAAAARAQLVEEAVQHDADADRQTVAAPLDDAPGYAAALDAAEAARREAQRKSALIAGDLDPKITALEEALKEAEAAAAREEWDGFCDVLASANLAFEEALGAAVAAQRRQRAARDAAEVAYRRASTIADQDLRWPEAADERWPDGVGPSASLTGDDARDLAAWVESHQTSAARRLAVQLRAHAEQDPDRGLAAALQMGPWRPAWSDSKRIVSAAFAAERREQEAIRWVVADWSNGLAKARNIDDSSLRRRAIDAWHAEHDAEVAALRERYDPNADRIPRRPVEALPETFDEDQFSEAL